MSRKDFELIAKTIKDTRFSGVGTAHFKQVLAREFADALAGTNPNFNRARFLKACGVEDA